MKEKIALVTEFYPPHIGGQEIRFQDLARQFSRRGYDVHVYTIRYAGDLAATETRENVTIFRLVDDFAYASGNGLRQRSPLTILRFALQAAWRLKKDRYRFAVFNQFPLLPIIFARLLGVATVKLLDFVEFRHGLFWRLIQKLILLSSDKVVCISAGVRDAARTLCDKELHVIPSLVDISQFSEGQPKHFLFVGRLEAHKHPEDAIAAVLRYNGQNGTHYPLHVVGGGSLLPALAEKYRDNPTVTIHGFVDDTQKAALLSESIALLLPSEREGLPKSVIEAVASGVPVITTDYPQNGTKEFVAAEKIGIVAPPAIDELAAAIAWVLANSRQLRATCRRLAPAFNLSDGADKYIEIGQGDNHGH